MLSSAPDAEVVGRQRVLDAGADDLLSVTDPFVSNEGSRGPDLLRPRPQLRIVPGELGGSPHVVHTRLESQALGALANSGLSEAKIYRLYPQVAPDAIDDALDLERSSRTICARRLLLERPVERMPRLFALDHNLPTRSCRYSLTFRRTRSSHGSIRSIPAWPIFDDWELLVALHPHVMPWEGLITTDSSMFNQGPELAALIQTKLTLVVATASGDDPVKASGLLFAYLSGICRRTRPDVAQVWTLSAASNPHRAPWDYLKRLADHNNRTESVWDDFRLSDDELAHDPLDY